MKRAGRSANNPEGQKVIRGSRSIERSHNRKGVSDEKGGPVSGQPAAEDPTTCRGCGAVYTRKKWHASAGGVARRTGTVTCPACLQVSANEFLGRVIFRSPEGDEEEIRRRIDNVARRAASTEPERRVVAVERRGPDLDVFTTSQKLAHRIAREVEKAFGGGVHYAWADGDGSLLAIWSKSKTAAV